MEFLLPGFGPEVAIVANAGRDDGDSLRRRCAAVEELGVDGPIRPAGAEALGAGSVAGPPVVRGIRGEIWCEANDYGCGAEDISVPIDDGTGRRGVDVDFLWGRLGTLDFRLGRKRRGAGGKE